MQIEIKKYRKQKNITQTCLAKALNVSANTISAWENGKSFPDVYLLSRLADYFHITTDELLGRKINYNIYLNNLEKNIVTLLRKLTSEQIFSVLNYIFDISSE